MTEQLRIIDRLSKSETILDNSKENNQLLHSLQFILCQLDNLFRPKTHRIYNIETVVIALKCQLIPPAYYHYLQSLETLSLPHYTTLQRLYTKFGLDSEYITFLEKATSDFNQRERNVIVQMDEIHVKSEFTYKGGIIIGSSQNITDPAKTIRICFYGFQLIEKMVNNSSSTTMLEFISNGYIPCYQASDRIYRALWFVC